MSSKQGPCEQALLERDRELFGEGNTCLVIGSAMPRYPFRPRRSSSPRRDWSRTVSNRRRERVEAIEGTRRAMIMSDGDVGERMATMVASREGGGKMDATPGAGERLIAGVNRTVDRGR